MAYFSYFPSVVTLWWPSDDLDLTLELLPCLIFPLYIPTWSLPLDVLFCWDGTFTSLSISNYGSDIWHSLALLGLQYRWIYFGGMYFLMPSVPKKILQCEQETLWDMLIWNLLLLSKIKMWFRRDKRKYYLFFEIFRDLTLKWPWDDLGMTLSLISPERLSSYVCYPTTFVGLPSFAKE